MHIFQKAWRWIIQRQRRCKDTLRSRLHNSFVFRMCFAWLFKELCGSLNIVWVPTAGGVAACSNTPPPLPSPALIIVTVLTRSYNVCTYALEWNERYRLRPWGEIDQAYSVAWEDIYFAFLSESRALLRLRAGVERRLQSSPPHSIKNCYRVTPIWNGKLQLSGLVGSQITLS